LNYCAAIWPSRRICWNSASVWLQPVLFEPDFFAELGVTIPQYLRQLRMERAAELLRSGKFNVTEAALEVGIRA